MELEPDQVGADVVALRLGVKMLRPPKEEIVFGRKPKTKHCKELLEIRGDPGKFNVSGIKGEENFKKEMVDLQHLLL